MDARVQLETKAGLPADTLVTHDEMLRVLEAVKEANDQRLATIEKHGSDVLLEEKVARISTTIAARQRFIERATLRSQPPALRAARGTERWYQLSSDRSGQPETRA